MYSYVVLLSLVSAAVCAPQSYNRQRQSGPFEIIPIISERSSGPLNGAYNFEFQTGNGIRRNEQGSPSGPNGAVVSQGGWAFTFPDGTPAQFSFVADEGGYRVESPLLPKPHPLPRHAIEQIERAARERAQGIVHDGQYDPSRYGGGQVRRGGQTQGGRRRFN